MIIGYINKQSLRIGQNLVVTGTIDYLEAEFHFTDDWTGLQKWAHFKCGENDYTSTVQKRKQSPRSIRNWQLP